MSLLGSPALFSELHGVISRSKFRTALARYHIDAARELAELHRVELIDPPHLPFPVCRDPDDDALLALAIAAQADLIISGDADLIVLGSYAGIPIMPPAEALAMIDPAPP